MNELTMGQRIAARRKLLNLSQEALAERLDISRQAMIVMVKRRGTMLIPHDDLRLREGDHIILYSQSRIADAEQIPN